MTKYIIIQLINANYDFEQKSCVGNYQIFNCPIEILLVGYSLYGAAHVEGREQWMHQHLLQWPSLNVPACYLW